MKLIKRILIGIVLLLVTFSGILYFYKDALIRKVVDKINQEYNIEIAYQDVGIGLLKSFPDATLNVNKISIINEAPFKGDTLVFINNIYLNMNIKDVFKKNLDKIRVKNLVIDQAKVFVLVDSLGQTNYDIHKINSTANLNQDSNNTQEFTFQIKNYEINNSKINFTDKQSNMQLLVSGLNHSGNGDFSVSNSDLSTTTTIDSFTFEYGGVAYLNKVKMALNAIIGMDLTNMKFTLKDNNLSINDLNLILDGYLQHNPNNEDINLVLKSPKANFKSVLSLIPNAYSSDFKGVSANGIANLQGKIQGIYSANSMPNYTITIQTDKASFKYPDLPKSIDNITFNGKIENNSKTHNPYVVIKKLKFQIDQDMFETNGSITNLLTNPTVDAFFKGKLNLDNLYQAYPIKSKEKITGILQADFHTKLDQKAIENSDFKNLKTNGTASLESFSYSGENLSKPLFVDNATIEFNKNTIKLTDFKAKTGNSDIQATGVLDNLYAFMFNDKKLKGNFNVTSTNFVVSDFLVDENPNTTAGGSNETPIENLKIPDFLDITTKVKAKQVVYDDLLLNDVSTLMTIKDQKAFLKNTSAKMMQGKAYFNGLVDTKKTPATFDFDLNLNKFDIATSFNELETFQKIAPIANALKGKFNSNFKIEGDLKNDLTPDLNSLSGNILAQLFVKDVNNKSNPLFTALTSKFNFLDLKKIDWNKLKASLSFKNGKVHLNPLKIKYKDILIHVSGSHGFDKSLQYNMQMDLPAKYLGNEAQKLMTNLSNIDKDTIKIPLSTSIQGTINKPIIKANFKQALSDLAVKITKYQKEKLVNQATNEATNIVNNVLANNGLDSIIPIKKDTTKNDLIKDGVNDLINGIFKKKKKK